jgi:putative oxidoreductase
MSDKLNGAGLLVGRILLGQIFFVSGVMKLLQWSQTADSMANEGMVAVPFFLGAAAAVEILGGLAVILGFQSRWGSLALAAFLIPVSLIFHDFWTYQGQEMQNQMQHFMKNVTIFGGLLTLAAAGAGRFSLDALRANSTEQVFEEVHEQRGVTAGYDHRSL